MVDIHENLWQSLRVVQIQEQVQPVLQEGIMLPR